MPSLLLEGLQHGPCSLSHACPQGCRLLVTPQQYAELPLPKAQQEPRSGGPSSPDSQWQQLLTQQEAQQLQAMQRKQVAQLAAQKLQVRFASPLHPAIPASDSSGLNPCDGCLVPVLHQQDSSSACTDS